MPASEDGNDAPPGDLTLPSFPALSAPP